MSAAGSGPTATMDEIQEARISLMRQMQEAQDRLHESFENLRILADQLNLNFVFQGKTFHPRVSEEGQKLVLGALVPPPDNWGGSDDDWESSDC